MVFIKQDVIAKRLIFLEFTLLENINMELTNSNKIWAILFVLMPSSQQNLLFSNELTRCFIQIANYFYNSLVTGNVNMNLTNLKIAPSSYFSELQDIAYVTNLKKRTTCVKAKISHNQLQICCLVGPVRDTCVCASFDYGQSSSAAELAASSDQLGPHGSVQISTIVSHHQLQNLLPHRTR